MDDSSEIHAQELRNGGQARARRCGSQDPAAAHRRRSPELPGNRRRSGIVAARGDGTCQAARGSRRRHRLPRARRPRQGGVSDHGVCRRALREHRLRRRRAAHAPDAQAPRCARMSPRGGRRLLRSQSRGPFAREPAGRAARPQGQQQEHDHPHDHRAGHAVREARPRPHGARLMAALRGKALVAYLLVCVFWGSTYLAIRVGVGELPPFLFAGLRFFIAGAILFAGALAFCDRAPRRAVDWLTLVIVGLFLLAGGNAFVVWAEQYTPSGAASIFVVTVALWMAFFDAVIPGGSGALGWRVIAGLILGFLGTGLLVGANPAEILHADLRGPIALTCASASWSLGSVYGKRHKTATSPYVGAALQMLAGGGAVVLLGTALGEWSRWHLTAKGAGAVVYLVVFGSILGYSAYTYALRHASPTIVGTYAYVNPVIAVLLGWLILREPVTARTFVAMAMILGAVVWIQFSHKVPGIGRRAVAAAAASE